MRVLAIDYGAKKIGLAVSDPTQTIAQPFGVVDNSPSTIKRLARLCQNEAVGLVVMGEPIRLNRSANPILKSTQAFASRLIKATGLPLVWQPEWFTTTEARRLVGPRHRERLDAAAAALILTGYLERQKHNFSHHA